jgi:LDH2 family malate/lactate/ureidoglycolate dehydrogenase
MYKHADEPSETSHMFMVIDPEFFLERSEFEDRMTEWVKMIKATPMTESGATQIIPGEIEYNCEQQRRKEGLPIPPELAADLEALAEKLGISAKLF